MVTLNFFPTHMISKLLAQVAAVYIWTQVARNPLPATEQDKRGNDSNFIQQGLKLNRLGSDLLVLSYAGILTTQYLVPDTILPFSPEFSHWALPQGPILFTALLLTSGFRYWSMFTLANLHTFE